MDRRLAVLFVTAFVDMVGLTMVIPLLPYYATEFGASAMMVGVLVSTFVVAPLAADVSPPSQRTKSLGWLSAVTSLGPSSDRCSARS